MTDSSLHLGHSDSRPMFRFTTSSTAPAARVVCLNCGWKTTGRVPSRVFRRADKHVCDPVERYERAAKDCCG